MYVVNNSVDNESVDEHFPVTKKVRSLMYRPVLPSRYINMKK